MVGGLVGGLIYLDCVLVDMRKFTDENTSGFTESEIDNLNDELESRLQSDELKGIENSERVKIISERILERY